MTGIFVILESSATQCYQDVTPTQKFFLHRHIYSLGAYLQERTSRAILVSIIDCRCDDGAASRFQNN